jgi:hypothetical protein
MLGANMQGLSFQEAAGKGVEAFKALAEDILPSVYGAWEYLKRL